MDNITVRREVHEKMRNEFKTLLYAIEFRLRNDPTFEGTNEVILAIQSYQEVV